MCAQSVLINKYVILKLKVEQLLRTLKRDDFKPALFVASVSSVIVETGGFPGQSKQRWFFSTLSLANSIPCPTLGPT